MQPPLYVAHLLHVALNYSSTGPSAGSLTEYSCPFAGQIYPPPTVIASSPIWKTLVSNLNDTLSSIPSVANNLSSHAVQVVSLHEPDPLFEHYGKARDHRHGHDGIAPVDGDTVFRIASVSKMFTVYALLLKAGFKCFEDPITKYVPELAGRIVVDRVDDVDWSEITVGALASQISGIGRDYALADLASIPIINPDDTGLPNVDPSKIPHCGADPAQPPCNRAESIELILQHAPNFPAEYSPTYSNMAFQLLSYVLENVTGRPYNEIMTDSVFKPLGLRHTTVSLPDLADGIIRPGDPTFEWDLGDDAATGGIYSSTNDLATFARAVLNNTQLSPSQTRRWLKPRSHTSLLQLSFGAPWEILRIPGLSLLHNIDLYTKSGNLGTYRDPTQYNTLFALIPDIEIAIIINSYSADQQGTTTIIGAVEQQVLKPLYDIAKMQAVSKFAGTYVDERSHVNSSFTISFDNDIGLTVSELISNGTDFLALLRLSGYLSQTVRLYPTTLTADGNRKGVHRVAFRATIVSPAGQCLTNFLADGFRYAGIGLDLVVFETEGQRGKAYAVELPAFTTTLRRVETSLRVQ